MSEESKIISSINFQKEITNRYLQKNQDKTRKNAFNRRIKPRWVCFNLQNYFRCWFYVYSTYLNFITFPCILIVAVVCNFNMQTFKIYNWEIQRKDTKFKDIDIYVFQGFLYILICFWNQCENYLKQLNLVYVLWKNF